MNGSDRPVRGRESRELVPDGTPPPLDKANGAHCSPALDPSPVIPASAMATLHRPNLESVRKDPWVQSHFRPEELDEIAVGLERIGAETGHDTSIEKFLRVVIARA
jgi:hypothetical protein